MDPLALKVTSRFEGLKVEDDPNPSTTGAHAKKPDPKKKEGQKKKSRSRNKNKTPAMPSTSAEEQWEEWKIRDEKFVRGNFEAELQQAIHLSKIEYEENKDLYQERKKELDNLKRLKGRAAKKQQKRASMSLDDFKDMLTREGSGSSDAPAPKESSFFERVNYENRHAFIKDKINERIKARYGDTEFIILELLEKREREIEALKTEVSQIKVELSAVKSHNKKLTNILAQGEPVFGNGDFMLELERLRVVQAQLTAEIGKVNSLLERERNKTEEIRSYLMDNEEDDNILVLEEEAFLNTVESVYNDIEGK